MRYLNESSEYTAIVEQLCVIADALQPTYWQRVERVATSIVGTLTTVENALVYAQELVDEIDRRERTYCLRCRQREHQSSSEICKPCLEEIRREDHPDD